MFDLADEIVGGRTYRPHHPSSFIIQHSVGPTLERYSIEHLLYGRLSAVALAEVEAVARS